MSIKSHKSISDEYSEIFDESYSVRSVSCESLSCEDDDDGLARELMHKLTPAILSKLRRCFKKNKERNYTQDIDRRVEEVMRQAAAEEGIEFASSAPPLEDPQWLDEVAFVASINNIFGHHKYATHAHELFQLLDAFSTGKVWWKQLVSRLVAVGARKTRSRVDVWTPVSEPVAKRLGHCKRETIVKMVCVERPGSFCYVVVSKGGRVGVYSGELQLLHSYEDVQYMLMSSSDRSLAIYDATTVAHTLIYCINGLPNIPTCLAYSPSPSMSSGSELSFGTERGDVIRMRFLRPRIQFLHNNTTDAANFYYWMLLHAVQELSCPPHTAYCAVSVRRAHARCVRRLQYSRGGGTLLSAAHDAGAGARATHLTGNMDDHVYKLRAGVSCFHMVSELQLLVTGSVDGVVRLWGSYQGQPFAKLQPPTVAPVLDVAVIPGQEIVVAFCNNCMVHIWDLYEECLLQNIKIKFPFLGVLGKKLDFGTYSIHPGPARKEPEEEVPDLPELLSRRGSSVFQGSTGGLMLQLEKDSDGRRRLEEEPEYALYNRPELLVSCCDYVAVVPLGTPLGAVLPPPGDSRRPRRPSAWELPDYPLMDTVPSHASSAPLTLPTLPTAPLLLSPSTVYSAEVPTNNLETLLENAGLKGILEKDFVLMQGLKNDLNRKLAEIEANKDTMTSAVSACAPHLALRMHTPELLRPAPEMTDVYQRVMRLFPGPSVTGTPTGSGKSTPRPSPRQNATSQLDTTPRPTNTNKYLRI